MTGRQISDLNLEELITLKAALTLFISNDIEEIPPDKKLSENVLAISTLNEFSLDKSNFNTENLRIMASALFYFDSIIHEITVIPRDKESNKHLSNISSVLSIIENHFNTVGISLYSL